MGASLSLMVESEPSSSDFEPDRSAMAEADVRPVTAPKPSHLSSSMSCSSVPPSSPSGPATPCISSDSISISSATSSSTGCASSSCGCSQEPAEAMADISGVTPLIPGLPDELAVECLLRLPRRVHRRAKGVCRRWRDFIQVGCDTGGMQCRWDVTQVGCSTDGI